MSGVGVGPYAELTFDADGDPDAAQRAALLRLDATDLVLFSHGWNSDRSVATRLYDRFFAPFPELTGPGVRLGYAGVLWPSMRFSDEPIPDFDPPRAAPERPAPARPFGSAVRDAAAAATALDAPTRAALDAFWPGRAAELGRVAELLATQPESAAAFAEFGALVRALAGMPDSPAAAAAAPAGGPGDALPALFGADTLGVCADLTQALAESGASLGGAASASLTGGLRTLWNGGKELLRQATYYTMKKRAGHIGEHGLGPVLGQLARSRPGLRVHLVGHSFGARLVSCALRGLPPDVRTVKSLTLLQGAFSHYAFSESLPHDRRRSGHLGGLQTRVDGPVVSCHSRHDSALGVFYPLASRLARDSAGFGASDARWGAVGHDGIHAVPGTVRLTLDAALREGLPRTGCASVDAAEVVRRGGAPSGAHSDICHEALARVVVTAGRFGR
ncbi:serine-threonine protein kinase [Streptomyces bambusae]|uniref:serine-threonine protein kinase n=1 Tax=Streptomyces bambusae TaxID=1550616 RepID=UPI001CFF56DE|nr:serine-threonine protein kinase [Streptomyces bambusae]MCB5169733.1 serine-threonine protein kinase [Streptomyces bambusae]